MKGDSIRELTEFAVEVARAAGRVAQSYYQKGLRADSKADHSPVTVADLESERVAREMIRSRYPADGILGEEFGEEQPGADRRWILDPIDGTRTFIRGAPLWGTMVAIELDGGPLVGVLHFPALAETVYAGTGLGCWWNGQPASVSDKEILTDALVLTTDPNAIANHTLGDGWERLARTSALTRSWGDCFGYAMVATGRAEAMIDPVLSYWDIAALIPIMHEAGGVLTDSSGGNDYPLRGALATNWNLADEIRGLLKGNQ